MQEHRLSVARTARYFTLGERSGAAAEVWFACHGYGQLAGRFLEKLRALDDGTRYLVAPEGLSRFYLSESSTERRVGAMAVRGCRQRLRLSARRIRAETLCRTRGWIDYRRRDRSTGGNLSTAGAVDASDRPHASRCCARNDRRRGSLSCREKSSGMRRLSRRRDFFENLILQRPDRRAHPHT